MAIRDYRVWLPDEIRVSAPVGPAFEEKGQGKGIKRGREHLDHRAILQRFRNEEGCHPELGEHERQCIVHAVVKDLKEGRLKASQETVYARAGMNPSFEEYRRNGSSLNVANMFLLKELDSRMYGLASEVLPGRFSRRLRR